MLVQQTNFEKTFIKVCSPYLYASFGKFCVQIGQLFEAQRFFEKCLKTVKSLFSKENVVTFDFFVTRKFYQFGRKIELSKEAYTVDVSYQLLREIFQKYFDVLELSAVKKLLITYVWSKVDSYFFEACIVAVA